MIVRSLNTTRFASSAASTELGSGTQAIVARDVSMQFHSGSQSFQALKDISLVVNQGDVHLLMGPSGSGKTTLLSILGGILHPSDGKVQALGQNLLQLTRSQLSEFRLNHFGFIFQEFNLLPTLTATENIELILKLKGAKKREARQLAMNLLDQVDLADRADYLPRDLSGGQKQRVAIARALAGNPKILMADEPTAALDSHSGHAVIALLRRLAKEAGHTVVMVTHDPRIMDVADQITYLEDGKLQERQFEKLSKSRVFPLSA